MLRLFVEKDFELFLVYDKVQSSNPTSLAFFQMYVPRKILDVCNPGK